MSTPEHGIGLFISRDELQVLIEHHMDSYKAASQQHDLNKTGKHLRRANALLSLLHLQRNLD